MNLIKETLSHFDEIQGYNKTYDQSGKLIYEHIYSPIIGNKKTDFIYDQEGRLSKKIIKSYSFSGIVDVVTKKYDYQPKNLKVITFTREKNRNYFKDSYGVKEDWNVINEIFKKETIEYKNGLLLYKHIEDIDKKKETTKEYKYDFNNNCTDFIENGKVEFNKEYFYKDNLVTAINEYKYFNNKKFLAFTENHFYDKDNKLIKTEKRGLYNSKMYLYKIVEFQNNEEFSTELYKEYYHFNEFLGYYDYDSMRIANKDNFQLVFLGVNTFENKEFDVCVFKKFDSRNDLIESYHIDHETGKQSNKKIFIYEYINEEFKDFELCLKFDKNDSVEKDYIRKFIY